MRTAVVTGAGRGIGLQIAHKLSARGYAVLLTTRDEQAGRRAAKQVGPSAWSTRLDVRDPDGHRAVAALATGRGPLAIWVNNAGVVATKPAWEHTDEDIRLLVETNLSGVIFGCLAAVEAMGDDGGRILNVASISGLGPVPGLSVYAATKHAVVGFTSSLQGDLQHARLPIRAHALCPGPVATDMLADRSSDPAAAVLFSGNHLSAERVADQAVAMLSTRRVLQPLPSWQGHLMRAAGTWPAIGLRALAIARCVGEYRLRV
jgi:NAD(P)-dependent dehydrogenase (short-subunit alcohol dehydrogenase family)